MDMSDKIGWKSEWRIDKFKDPEGKIAEMLRKGVSIRDAIMFAGDRYIGSELWEDNVALNEGLQYLIDIVTGIEASPTKWDNANARVGVGNSNVAASPSQAGLQGASTAFASMDSGYPQRSNQTATWRGTFGSGEANFAWEEYTVDNGATSNRNLNRYVTSKGTKQSGETWTLSVQITFS